MVLGILGPLIDSNLRRAISIEHNSFLGFSTSLFTPISHNNDNIYSCNVIRQDGV